jgi:hypothetical protein
MRFPLIFLCCPLVLSACSDQQSDDHGPDVVPADYAIVDTTAITMTEAGVLDNVTIFVAGGEILRVASISEAIPSEDTPVIDGKNRYVIPGLADMHIHVPHLDILPLFAANGVTFVRDMWGSKGTLARRDQIITETLFAPLMIVAGPGIDGEPATYPGNPTATTASDATGLVAEQIDAGYDFIKVYDRVSPAVFRAAIAAGSDQGVAVTGHAPFSMSYVDAVVSGIDSLEHLQGFHFASARDEVGIAASPINPNTEYPKLFAALQATLASGGAIADLFDDEKIEHLARLNADQGVYNTPTLITLLKGNTPSDEWPLEFARNELKFVHPEVLDLWRPENNFRFGFLQDQQLKGLRLLQAQALTAVGALNRAGAKLLLGTDTPTAFVVPGLSVHQELVELTKAGLTPLEALATATTNPAEFLGQAGQFGVIAAGARADIVLLNGNPMDDIRNTEEIDGVMIRGSWYSDHDIQLKLNELADQFER